MTRQQEQRIGTGARVMYRGFEMVVAGVATVLEKGLPRVLSLAWPERPATIVYPRVVARFCTLVTSDD